MWNPAIMRNILLTTCTRNGPMKFANVLHKITVGRHGNSRIGVGRFSILSSKRYGPVTICCYHPHYESNHVCRSVGNPRVGS
jgi:hypothetical protein